jgi:hypothetical protein
VAFTGNYVCNSFLSGSFDGAFDFGPGTADVYKLALYTNSATLNAETAVYTTDEEVVASGYTAGGPVITPTKGIGNTSTSGGTAFVTFANVTVSAALTARGALIYKVGSGNPAVCVLDFGSDKTSTTTFTVTFPLASSTDALIRLS